MPLLLVNDVLFYERLVQKAETTQLKNEMHQHFVPVHMLAKL